MTDYQRIANAISYINEHFQEQPELEQVAKEVFLSPFHFQRLFKEWAGVSPKKFLQFISIQHAKKLLLPLATAVAKKIRISMEDDYGHELKHSTPAGRALCRLCLADGGPHQKHILFSYMPFDENKNPYSEVGPVYVHDKCEPYEELNVFPPDLKKRKYLQVRGYDARQSLIAADLAKGSDPEETIDKLFEDLQVEYLHIRDGLTGCYFLKIERS